MQDDDGAARRGGAELLGWHHRVHAELQHRSPMVGLPVVRGAEPVVPGLDEAAVDRHGRIPERHEKLGQGLHRMVGVAEHDLRGRCVDIGERVGRLDQLARDEMARSASRADAGEQKEQREEGAAVHGDGRDHPPGRVPANRNRAAARPVPRRQFRLNLVGPARFIPRSP